MKKIAYRDLFGKPEGKKLLERPRHIWKNHIRVDPGEK
jgi:hypothetical protein